MAFFREETRVRGEQFALAAVARRFVLRGRIATLASDGRVIPDGFVCVENDLIASVTSADAGLPAPGHDRDCRGQCDRGAGDGRVRSARPVGRARPAAGGADQ